MAASSYEPTKHTLGQVLSSTSPPLRVPEFQRDYSWEAKHVTDFWDDLHDFDRKNPSPDAACNYFLGTVVMVVQGNHNLLLDGQQRFATATILLSLIRDRLRPIEPKAADHIQSTWIAFDNPLDPSQERTYKLEMNTYDRAFFRRAVQDEETCSHGHQPKRTSHKLILDARRRLGGLLDTHTGIESDDAARRSRLLRLSKAVTQHFGVVSITSHDEDQAASIFETLNERGIGLSTADLLRSWIMSTARPKDREEIVRLWDKIGEDHGTRRVEGVIRTSWKSRHGDVKTRALYREIKDHLKESKVSPLDYTRQLAEDAEYLRLLAKGATGIEEIDQAARDLADVKAGSAFAAMLAAKNSLQDADRCTLAKCLVGLALRHNVICGLEPGHFESVVFDCAKEVTTSQSLTSAVALLQKLSPKDEDVRRALKRAHFPPKRSRAAHVILRAIEASKRTGETRVSPRRKVHLEHIYPQNPAGKRLRQHERIVYLLGNLTLLAGKLNRQASNRNYSRKKQDYKTSELWITNELPKNWVKWGRKPIEERQARLSRHFISIWPERLI